MTCLGGQLPSASWCAAHSAPGAAEGILCTAKYGTTTELTDILSLLGDTFGDFRRASWAVVARRVPQDFMTVKDVAITALLEVGCTGPK